jgi:hypothetical protein
MSARRADRSPRKNSVLSRNMTRQVLDRIVAVLSGTDHLDAGRPYPVGWVDSFSSQAISGWYVHPVHPMKICSIALNLEDGQRIIVTNGLQRPDIARLLGIPGLRAGFSFDAPLRNLGKSKVVIVSLEFPMGARADCVGAVIPGERIPEDLAESQLQEGEE